MRILRSRNIRGPRVFSRKRGSAKFNLRISHHVNSVRMRTSSKNVCRKVKNSRPLVKLGVDSAEWGVQKFRWLFCTKRLEIIIFPWWEWKVLEKYVKRSEWYNRYVSFLSKFQMHGSLEMWIERQSAQNIPKWQLTLVNHRILTWTTMTFSWNNVSANDLDGKV